MSNIFTRRPDTRWLLQQGCTFSQAFGILERGSPNTCSGPIPSNIQQQTQQFLQEEAAKQAPPPPPPPPPPPVVVPPPPPPAPRRKLTAREKRIERSRKRAGLRRRAKAPTRTKQGFAIDTALAKEIGL